MMDCMFHSAIFIFFNIFKDFKNLLLVINNLSLKDIWWTNTCFKKLVCWSKLLTSQSSSLVDSIFSGKLITRSTVRNKLKLTRRSPRIYIMNTFFGKKAKHWDRIFWKSQSNYCRIMGCRLPQQLSKFQKQNCQETSNLLKLNYPKARRLE